MKPRDPAEVIARVLKIVPESEVQLRLELEALATDSWFFPPEGKHPIWAQLRHIMLRRFPEPVEGWPAEASAIICGEREP